MNTAVRKVAKKYLSGRAITEGLLNHIGSIADDDNGYVR